MSSVFYNGCLLEHVKLVHSKKTAKFAGPNYLYTEYQITVDGLYNPALNSYAVDAQGRPVFTPGNLAPQTEPALAFALSQPRKPFAFVAANTLVTFSPRLVTVRSQQPTAPASAGVAIGLLGTVGTVSAGTRLVVRQRYGLTDCANGPFTAPPEVYENIGDKTFRVRFTVTTFLNDTPPASAFKGTPLGAKATGVQFPTSPLLANEYTCAQRTDQDFFTTRHISGRAVFRSDVLQTLQLFPDQLRYWLGHPVPDRMRREEINVEAQSDGVTLNYDFTDRERIINFDPNEFTRVEFVYRNELKKLGLESMAQHGLSTAMSTFTGMRRMVSRNASPFTRDFFTQMGLVFGGTLGALAGVLAGVPVVNHHVTARYWGHPRQSQKFMRQAAFSHVSGLVLDTLGIDAPGVEWLPLPTVTLPTDIPVVGGLVIGGGQIQMGDVLTTTTEDWSGRYVEIHKVWIGSRIQAMINHLEAGTPVPVRPVDPVRAILNDPMRGAHLTAAVASALRDSGDLWVQPQDPPRVTDRETRRPAGGTVAGMTLP